MTVARHWNEISKSSLSLEALRELHAPSSHYRISPNRYEAGVVFSGSSRAGRLYVLAGSCSKTVGSWHIELGAGMFVDYPSGSFHFAVEGTQGVQLVNVWLLPEGYRGQSEA
jgi:hypothetical protein